jgi:hypothetical protein
MKIPLYAAFSAFVFSSSCQMAAGQCQTIDDYKANTRIEKLVKSNRRYKNNKFPDFVFRTTRKDQYVVFLGSKVDDLPPENEVGMIVGIYIEELVKAGIKGKFTFLFTSKTITDKKVCVVTLY